MATFEDVGIAKQLVDNVYGIVNNIRENAGLYKKHLIDGRTVIEVSTIMVEDATQYKRRLQWLTDLAQRNQAKYLAALSVFAITPASATALRNELIAISDHTIAANKNDAGQINTEADYILANAPNYERVW